MKLIFLDIDGVLALMHKERDEYGSLFHPEFVENLKSIIDATGAKIVISSTWRASGLEIMQEMWLKRGLPGEVIAITPFSQHRFRGLEIKEYLSNNMQFQRINWSKDEQLKWVDKSLCKNYVILDDDSDMTYNQREHFVKCSCNFTHSDSIEGYGLTKQCAEQAIKILNTDVVDLYYTTHEQLDSAFGNKQVKSKERWLPALGEGYYFINDCITPIKTYGRVKKRFEVGNCFETKEKAEQVATLIQGILSS